MIESINPFLLLKHLDILREQQTKVLAKSIVAQLRVLNSAIEEGKFSGEQIAEMEIWIANLKDSIKNFHLGDEGSNLIKKICDAF